MRGPVVVVFLDGWGVQGGAPAALPGAASLEALVRENPWTTVAATGASVTEAGSHPSSEHAGYRAAGTGAKAKLARPRVDRALAAEELGRAQPIVDLVTVGIMRRGRATDFITEIARDQCTAHLFGLISDASSHGHVADLEAVAEIFSFHDLPFLVHAIVDGVDVPQKTAWHHIERLEARLHQLGGRVATISGRDYAFDTTGDWDKTLELYRTVVFAEGDRFEDVNQALTSTYVAGYGDSDLKPVIIGDYSGIQGGLVGDYGPAGASWTWRGEDTGVFVGLRGESYRQLAAVLTRTGLPAEIAERVAIRERAVHAFDQRCLASFVGISTVPDIAVIFPEDAPPFSLGAWFAGRGHHQLRIASTGREDHVVAHFDAGAPPHDRSSTAHHASDAEALARATSAVRDASAALVVVALGGLDRASRSDEEGALASAATAIDGGIGPLAEAVRARGGLLVVTSSHGPTVHAPGGEQVPLVVAGAGAIALRTGGTLADLAPTVLGWMGADIPPEITGRTLFEPKPEP